MKNVRDFIPAGADVQMASDAIRAVVATGGALFFEPTITYTVLSSFQAPPGTFLMGGGYGSCITCPDAGWAMDSSDHFGLINVKNASDVRITGLRLRGTKSADQGHTPKLVYVENADGVALDHCWLEHSAWEGVWMGGTRQTNRGLRIEANDFQDIGFPNAYVGLPALQLNAQESVVTGNRFYNVGSGIGICGTRNTVSVNELKEVALAGISTGDGGENGANAIASNVVELAYAANGAVQVGILNGGGTPLYANGYTGNVVRIRGSTAGNAIAYRHVGGACASFTGNTAEIDVRGIGFEAYGSGAGEIVSFGNNLVRVTNESGSSYGFVGVPNGAGNRLTMASSDNRVFGLTRAQGSFAFDYNANGGGTLTALMMNDLQSEGALRIGGTYYGAGQFDFLPINLSCLNYVHP